MTRKTSSPPHVQTLADGRRSGATKALEHELAALSAQAAA